MKFLSGFTVTKSRRLICDSTLSDYGRNELIKSTPGIYFGQNLFDKKYHPQVFEKIHPKTTDISSFNYYGQQSDILRYSKAINTNLISPKFPETDRSNRPSFYRSERRGSDSRPESSPPASGRTPRGARRPVMCHFYTCKLLLGANPTTFEFAITTLAL
jgi:hypothetical protein